MPFFGDSGCCPKILDYTLILGVTEILSSFRLVLEGKAGKDMVQIKGITFLNSQYICDSKKLKNKQNFDTKVCKKWKT